MLFLANTGLPDLPPALQSALILGLVMASLFTLCSFTLVGLQIWNLLRPKTDTFVTRQEFQALRDEITSNRESNAEHFAQIATKLDNTQRSMTALSSDLMRAIGRIEGREGATRS